MRRCGGSHLNVQLTAESIGAASPRCSAAPWHIKGVGLKEGVRLEDKGGVCRFGRVQYTQTKLYPSVS